MSIATTFSREPGASAGQRARPRLAAKRALVLAPPLVLVVLCWFLFFHRLADRGLWSSHEARAAQDAQTILSDGDWLLPRLFDRKVELQKPPLYYWLVAAAGRLGGGRVDAWAVRLPAALAGLGCVLGLYLLGLARGRPLAGFVAAAVLATALHFTWLSRVGRIDMPLTLATGLALGAYYLGQRRRGPGSRGGWRWFLLGYVAVAAGLMLKGPIAVVLPAAVVGIHLLIEGEIVSFRRAGRDRVSVFRLAYELGLWWGLPLVAALVAPWYGWAELRTNGEWSRVFFWYHNFERGFGGAGPLAAHPWWFYGPRLAVDLLPWSLLLPAAAWSLLRARRWRRDPEARFGLVWLLAVLAVLSCMRFKRADYLLPAYPGAALLLGCVAERWYRRAQHPARLAVAFGLTLAGCLAGWLVYLDHVLPRQEAGRAYVRLAEEIRRRAPAPQLILFFRAEAHTLAFHVGRPVDTILEWENLDAWARRREMYYVVMPPEEACQWRRRLRGGQLEEVMRSTDLAGGGPEHPLVLLRTLPGAGPPAP
jgi:4-amino-4-deoxy-L-arabinose transferase-like glycosyltransferase